MQKTDPAFAAAEEAISSAYTNLVNTARWIAYPMVVSFETYAKCNAACSFCPYPDLTRIGEKLSPERVFALLDEVAGFEVAPARLNLSRVNEPFLDPNLFSYLDYAAKVLPQTRQVLFTNGQTVTDRTIDRLNAVGTFADLTISFNEHDAET